MIILSISAFSHYSVDRIKTQVIWRLSKSELCCRRVCYKLARFISASRTSQQMTLLWNVLHVLCTIPYYKDISVSEVKHNGSFSFVCHRSCVYASKPKGARAQSCRLEAHSSCCYIVDSRIPSLVQDSQHSPKPPLAWLSGQLSPADNAHAAVLFWRLKEPTNTDMATGMSNWPETEWAIALF